MKEVNKLAKQGWWKAMIHQGTLSLILTLDDFLMSGPHLCTDMNDLHMNDPNIFVIRNEDSSSTDIEEISDEHSFTVRTYYVLRPFIRGILYGLNPLYQISLYVPCNDPFKMDLYREIISKIDIGGQFFQDRIYWNSESLQHDVMDTRLACLIYAGNCQLHNNWLKKFSVESKPFTATMADDLSMSDNLFDLVEMRSLLEDLHQKYFSLLNESKRLYFTDLIRLHIEEKANKAGNQTGTSSISGFYSATNSQSTNKNVKRFISEGSSLKKKDATKKPDFMFKTSNEAPLTWKILNSNSLLNEYEDIIQEQLKINHDINHVSPLKASFAKTLCRWNTITQRKSDVLKLLMNQADKDHVNERLRQLNSVYCTKKFQSENEIFSSTQSSCNSSLSTGSGNNNYVIISDKHRTDETNDSIPIAQFTTWYTKEIKL